MQSLLNSRKSGAAFGATIALLMVGLIPGTATAHSGGGEKREVHELVKALKKSTNHLKKVQDALDAGYVPITPCVAKPGEGAMGVHYLNSEFVDGKIDPEHPELLVFMPDERGKSKLVAVEFLVEGHKKAPMIAGTSFDPGPYPGSHTLHAWIYEKNPDGIFADFNPAIKCP